MRVIDLETKVIFAVDRIQSGQKVEDDFIECKREWPQGDKARQLAGSLNRAGGDPVIYIIGIDETNGAIHDLSGTDVLDWWAQITPKFDQTPPEMIRQVNVPIGADGEFVIAIAFASDRSPYVVKTKTPILEVPMREGTGTRSAKRDELLRLLIPTIKVPPAVTLSGDFYAEYYPSVRAPREEMGGGHGQVEGIRCQGNLRVYFEHSGNVLTTIPTHGMQGKVHVDNRTFNVSVTPHATKPTEVHQEYGVHVTRDGITLTGPGSAILALKLPAVSPEDKRFFRDASQLGFDLELHVLGAVRPLIATAQMGRVGPYEMKNKYGDNLKSAYQEILGNWNFSHHGLD
ncbi:hypothetical protein [Arthrobacter antibioticus]|uniref:hypothetical protein n=1 Tax=Arthrobacter sp. H35-MC1 TaxID=3046203 RepID=UPI0024BB8E02|nr:hypothetical protein [Arthrobacter sp. H35-MC1]MDJ0316171.1 hypothetical protein [Arthrobacter sp. H35-MC1]